MDVDAYIRAAISRDFEAKISALSLRPNLVPAADAFRDNMRRIFDLQQLPGWLCASMKRMAAEYTSAVLEVTGKVKVEGNDLLNRDLMAEVDTIYFSKYKAATDVISGVGIDSHEFSGMTGLMHTEFMNPVGPISNGFDAICQSMVATACTAFDVLGQDILEVKTGGTFTISGLGGLISKFEEHLDPNHADFVAAIKSEGAQAIALVRHKIIHTGGKIDQRFIDNVAAYCPTSSLLARYAALGIGAQIPLNGDDTQVLIDGMSDAACELLIAAHRWIP